MTDELAPPTPPTAPSMEPAYSIRAALRFGWTQTWANFGQILLGGLLIVGTEVAATVAQQICATRIQDSVNRGDGTPTGLALLEFVIVIANVLFELMYGIGIVRAALGAIDGEPVRASTLLRWRFMLPVFLAGLITTLGTILGLILLIIPGLVFMLMAYYAQYFIIDRAEGPWTAVKSSIRMVKANFGKAFLFFLASIGVLLLGVLSLVVGVFVAYPVIAFATAYTFRALAPRPEPTPQVS